jgi:hypothetical protein
MQCKSNLKWIFIKIVILMLLGLPVPIVVITMIVALDKYGDET